MYFSLRPYLFPVKSDTANAPKIVCFRELKRPVTSNILSRELYIFQSQQSRNIDRIQFNWLFLCQHYFVPVLFADVSVRFSVGLVNNAAHVMQWEHCLGQQQEAKGNQTSTGRRSVLFSVNDPDLNVKSAVETPLFVAFRCNVTSFVYGPHNPLE